VSFIITLEVLGRSTVSLLTKNPRVVIMVAIAATLVIGGGSSGSSNWLNATPSVIDHGMWTFGSSGLLSH
jgi:hypothetical protein